MSDICGERFWAVVDGALLPADAATIPVQDQGFLRGDGAFEVILVYGGHPFAAGEHLDRLERSCAALLLECSRRRVERDLLTLVDASGPRSYAVRILLTQGRRTILLGEPWTAPAGPCRLRSIENHPQPLLAGVKSLSYAGNMLSKRLALEEGYDDALWVSADGYILEAQTAAFFWVSAEGQLCTPPLTEPILDSITRRLVIDRLDVLERRCPPSELITCREAFLAGTTKEIQPVAAIDDRWFPDSPGEATNRAMEAYRQLIAARTSVAACWVSQSARAAGTHSE